MLAKVLNTLKTTNRVMASGTDLNIPAVIANVATMRPLMIPPPMISIPLAPELLRVPNQSAVISEPTPPAPKIMPCSFAPTPSTSTVIIGISGM